MKKDSQGRIGSPEPNLQVNPNLKEGESLLDPMAGVHFGQQQVRAA